MLLKSDNKPEQVRSLKLGSSYFFRLKARQVEEMNFPSAGRCEVRLFGKGENESGPIIEMPERSARRLFVERLYLDMREAKSISQAPEEYSRSFSDWFKAHYKPLSAKCLKLTYAEHKKRLLLSLAGFAACAFSLLGGAYANLTAIISFPFMLHNLRAFAHTVRIKTNANFSFFDVAKLDYAGSVAMQPDSQPSHQNKASHLVLSSDGKWSIAYDDGSRTEISPKRARRQLIGFLTKHMLTYSMLKDNSSRFNSSPEEVRKFDDFKKFFSNVYSPLAKEVGKTLLRSSTIRYSSAIFLSALVAIPLLFHAPVAMFAAQLFLSSIAVFQFLSATFFKTSLSNFRKIISELRNPSA